VALDPYLSAWWRQRKNRARSLSLLAWLRDLLVPIGVAALLVPFVRPTFLAFLDRAEETWPELVFGLVMRASLVVVGWLSLDVYTALVRGPTREVLAILPVDPARVARAELVRVATERWWLVPALAVVLSPLGLAAPGLWAGAVLALAGTFAVSLTTSATGHLLAIWIAESPLFAPLLDALRGNNPRPQAAFLYAPGGVLVALAGVLYAAASAVPGAARGEVLAWAQLLVPWIVAVLAWLPVPRLARATWFRGSIVLSEIDARYASLTDPEEAVRVYLDWVPRWLPRSWQPHALNDLRHGWRSRRTLVMLAWLLALLAVGVGWSQAPEAPWRSTVVAVAAVFLVASNGVMMSADEPPFLRAWLPSGGLEAQGARTVVLALWAAPPLAGAVLAALIRHGGGAALQVLGVGLVALLGALILAGTSSRLRERGMAVYAPVAAVMGAAWLAVTV
jgi:hypothetical protein